MKKIKRIMPNSIDKYLTTSSTHEILQDVRSVMESDNILCRKVLAGIIMVALDHIESSQALADLNDVKKEVLALEDKLNDRKAIQKPPLLKHRIFAD
ncbi:MAG: hypothetical protein ABFD50_23400 [Smithella sp.]